jgi:hypothetical protein
MPLICPNCKTVFNDPGGDPRTHYMCRVCGFSPLQRTPVAALSSDTGVGLMAGAAVGAAIGGLPGAIVGGLIGLIIGARQSSVRRQ